MDANVQDYLFDLQGYLILENAISGGDLDEMNQWIDDHQSYVEEPWSENDNPRERSRWIGNVETHTYNEENGVNFQNIIEGGPVFERLIDYPAWIRPGQEIHPLLRKWTFHPRELSQCPWSRWLHPHSLWWTCAAQLSDVSPEQHRRVDGGAD